VIGAISVAVSVTFRCFLLDAGELGLGGRPGY
jgi:hypothetical protein